MQCQQQVYMRSGVSMWSDWEERILGLYYSHHIVYAVYVPVPICVCAVPPSVCLCVISTNLYLMKKLFTKQFSPYIIRKIKLFSFFPIFSLILSSKLNFVLSFIYFLTYNSLTFTSAGPSGWVER